MPQGRNGRQNRPEPEEQEVQAAAAGGLARKETMVAGDRVPAAVLLRRLAAAAVLVALLSPGGVVVVESARNIGETCALGRNCAAGLHCETCVANGNVRPRCTRITPVDPQTKVRGRASCSPPLLVRSLHPSPPVATAPNAPGRLLGMGNPLLLA